MQKRMKKPTAALPYKSNSHLRRPLSENMDEVYKVSGLGKYDLILLAAYRSIQIAKGAKPVCKDTTHKPTVSALLEIQEGALTEEVFVDGNKYW